MLCPLREAALDTPSLAAIITDERTWTYEEADRAVSALHPRIETSKPVAFPAHPTLHSLFLLLALLRLSATPFPFSYRLPSSSLAPYAEHLQRIEHVPPLASPASAGISSDSAGGSLLLFTSGSSAQPKIASLALRSLLRSAEGSCTALGLTCTDRWLLSLPLFHVGGIGILLRCILARAAVVLSALPIATALGRHAITHVSLVPTQLHRLLHTAVPSPPKAILLSGAPIPPPLFARALSLGLNIYPGYGLTEMSSQVTMDSPSCTLTAGRTLPYRELSLHANGEILVRGEVLFDGYWEPTQPLLRPLTRDGWFATGDLGQWNAEGKLLLQGRRDNLFISGGENIQPEEIERALCTIPGISEAIVVPLPDEEFGARPVAFVEDASGHHTLHTVRAHLQEQLPAFKLPIQLLPLPAEAGLKRSRHALRALISSETHR